VAHLSGGNGNMNVVLGWLCIKLGGSGSESQDAETDTHGKDVVAVTCNECGFGSESEKDTGLD
jgi:hypothetical protein